jgi:hypothetical protein
MIVLGREHQRASASIISYERFCSKLLKALKADWERIFVESTGDVSKIPIAVAKLEGSAFQLTMLGAVVSVFGSDTQMKIYAETIVDIWRFTTGRSGYVALISTPEIILTEIIYVIGVISIARSNLQPWKILLQTPIYELHERDKPPTPLFLYSDIYYCDALGGNATKVNDHTRQVISNLHWLSAIAPKVEGQVMEYQLQVNLLLVLLTIHNGGYLWPDFARMYPQRVRPLVNKIKYDTEFRLQVADLFSIKQESIGTTFKDYLIQVAKRGLDKYFWNSISSDDFLTEDEKNLQK